MLRFAPSPTGDMHIGNLRAAIFNFIIAKQNGEKFLVRIEDTDSARNIEGADKEILALLNLFGLFWDKLVYQSENFPLHRKLAQNLIEKNKAFYCYATKDFLDKKREEASAQKKAFRYDDSWAEVCKSQNPNPAIRLKGIAESSIDSVNQKNPSLRDSAKQNRGNPPIKKSQNPQRGLPRSHSLARNDKFLDSSLRKCSAQNDKIEVENDNLDAESSLDSANQNNPSLRADSQNLRGKPPIEKNAESQGGLPHATSRARNDNIEDFAESISFFDAIKGECKFSQNELDSFVILREDKTPTYNFACAVDDMIYDISFIIRGEDHTSNTPKQMLIHRALGYDKAIKYAHLPIILNDEGKKMSKRESESSVKWLLSQGFLPRAIVNYLLLMGNNPPCEIFTLDEAIAWFDLSQLSKSPVRFDINQLRHINREHLKRLGADEMGLLLVESNEKLKQLVLNSSLGASFALGGNFGEQQTQKSSFIPKISSKYKTSTANTRICDFKNVDSANQTKIAESSLDSAKSQNLTKKPCHSKSFPCHSERSEESKKNPSLRANPQDLRGNPPIEKTQNPQGGLPRSHSLARNDEILDSSLRKCSAQNDKIGAENDTLDAESALDSANQNNPSLRDSAKQNRGKPHYENIAESQGGLPREQSSLAMTKNKAFAESTLTNSLGALGLIFLEEASTLNELNDKLNHIFAPKDLDNFEFGENARILKAKILRLAESSAESSALNDFESLKSALSNKVDFKGKAFFMPLRFLLTGAQKGPHLDTLYPHLRAFLSQILQILKDE